MTDGIDLGVDTTGLTQSLTKLPESVRKELVTVAKTLDADLADHARALASGDLVGVKTGQYRASIRGSVTSSETEVVGRVYSQSPLAHIIEEGAKRSAYDILPSSKQALSMVLGGRRVAFKKVHNPGSVEQGRHVLGQALDDRKAAILLGLTEAVAVGLSKSFS